MLPAMTLAMQCASRQSKAGIASKNRPHGAHAGIGPQGRAALPATGRYQSVLRNSPATAWLRPVQLTYLTVGYTRPRGSRFR